MSLTVSAKDWDAYIRRLAALDETAAEKMRDFVRKNGFRDMNALIDYAYALATKYGEGAATLAAAMYDAVAELSGKLFDPALPAETASYDQVAKTVQGVAKVSQNPEEMGSAVGRLVKQAGADTTLQNALRDGAEFAWVPSGDSCAFCITLASRAGSGPARRPSREATRNISTPTATAPTPSASTEKEAWPGTIRRNTGPCTMRPRGRPPRRRSAPCAGRTTPSTGRRSTPRKGRHGRSGRNQKKP